MAKGVAGRFAQCRASVSSIPMVRLAEAVEHALTNPAGISCTTASFGNLRSAMSQLPSVLSAVAATLAALLSCTTLYVTGRREQQRWLRESLVEAYSEYLEAIRWTPCKNSRSAIGERRCRCRRAEAELRRFSTSCNGELDAAPTHRPPAGYQGC